MRKYLALVVTTSIAFIVGCAQNPVRPNSDDIEGMRVTSIKGQIDYGYSLKELWLMKERGKVSMAGSGATKNGIYKHQEGMTLQSFIDLAGGSKCTDGSTITVKRILKNDFFAIGVVPLDGKIISGDTVYFNCNE